MTKVDVPGVEWGMQMVNYKWCDEKCVEILALSKLMFCYIIISKHTISGILKEGHPATAPLALIALMKSVQVGSLRYVSRMHLIT